MKLRHDISPSEACRWATAYIRLMSRIGPVAIVFDIDDTLLGAETMQPLRPTMQLYNACTRLQSMHGENAIVIYIVSARRETETNVRETVKDLESIGVYPRHENRPGYETLEMRPQRFGVDRVHEFKLMQRMRARAASAAHCLVTIGDQWWDVLPTEEDADKYSQRMPRAAGTYILTNLPPGEAATMAIKLPEAPEEHI